MFCVVVVNMISKEEYVFDIFDSLEKADYCVCELEQNYNLLFDMYSWLEFVIRDYKGV